MSITFHIELQDEDFNSAGLRCECGERLGLSFPTYKEAVAYYENHVMPQCDNNVCKEWGSHPYVQTQLDEKLESMPDVNFSNSNAYLIMERLGIEIDSCGYIDADELLGRAMTANIGRDDSGVPMVEYKGQAGARIIECGLPEGYFENALNMLREVATAAKQLNRGVTWG